MFEDSTIGCGKVECTCTQFSLLILFGQIFGVFPFKFDKKNCRLIHSWFSPLHWLNFAYPVGFFYYLFTRYARLKTDLTKVLPGTSFYVFFLSIYGRLISSGIIYLFANNNGILLGKVWSKIHAVTADLRPRNLKKVKYAKNAILVYLGLQLSVLLALLTMNHLAEINSELSALSYVMPVNAFFTAFIPDLLTGTYLVFIWIITTNFNEINDQLIGLFEGLKQEPASTGIQFCNKLARLRHVHEDLCEILELLQRSFGVQMVIIIISASTSFVTGLYAVIMTARGEGPQQFASFELGVGIQIMVISGVRLTGIILSCQDLKNYGNLPSNVLNKLDLANESDEVKFEVDVFLRKLGNSSVHTTFCDVFDIGNSFLATGTSYIVTYILILVQLDEGGK